MNKSRNKQFCILFLILFTFFISQICLYETKPAELCNTDFLRFHVIADSNSSADQALKLKVRDALVQSIQKDFALSHPEKTSFTAEEMRSYVESHLPEIKKKAKAVLRSEGCRDNVNAKIGIRWIPEKTYGSVSFPAGLYEALTVTIGKGEGENWWCVLFPPLCLIGVEPPADCSEPDPAQIDSYYMNSVDSEKYKEILNAESEGEPHQLQLRFKILDLFK